MRKRLGRFFQEHGIRYLGSFCLFLLCGYAAIVAQLPITELSNTSVPVFGLISSIENHFFDLRAGHLWREGPKAANLTVLSIDEESIKQIGRWPWSRRVLAGLVDRLHALDAKAVFFDVIEAEQELSCTVPGRKVVSADDALAAAIKGFSAQRPFSQVIVGYGLTDNKEDALTGDTTSLLFTSMLSSEQAPKIQGLRFLDKNNFILPGLLDAGSGLGFINGIADADGVYRHAKIVSSVDDVPVPSGGLALFQSYFRRDATDFLSLRPADGTDIFLVYGHGHSDPAPHRARVDSFGQVRIRFLGGRDRFEHFSVGELYKADLTRPEVRALWRNRIEGKAILVGSEAMGAHDLRHTPVDSDLPGLYIHANLFHMLDEGFFFRDTQENINLSFLLLCLGLALGTLVAHLGMPVLDVLAMATFVVVIAILDRTLFLPRGYHLSLFFAAFAALSCYGWNTFLNIRREIRERRRVRNLFGHYVSDKIVTEMLAKPELMKLGGERREITMFFSDIRSFSTIGEKLAPQELALLLNIYMTKMVEVLFAFDGTLERFVGDAMVAFWSAPIELPEHAFAGVGCAVAMLEALPAVNEELQKRKLPAIAIGIGLNTGSVAVGNMGSDKIFSYTAHGDAMNLAARLEGMTKFYGAGIAFSEFTLRHMGEKAKRFVIRPLDKVQVKGRETAVAIFEALPRHHPLAIDAEAFRGYGEAYERYMRRDFSGAIELLEKIAAAHQDPATEKLLERAREFQRVPPPEGWDGVTAYSSK